VSSASTLASWSRATGVPPWYCSAPTTLSRWRRPSRSSAMPSWSRHFADREKSWRAASGYGCVTTSSHLVRPGVRGRDHPGGSASPQPAPRQGKNRRARSDLRFSRRADRLRSIPRTSSLSTAWSRLSARPLNRLRASAGWKAVARRSRRDVLRAAWRLPGHLRSRRTSTRGRDPSRPTSARLLPAAVSLYMALPPSTEPRPPWAGAPTARPMLHCGGSEDRAYQLGASSASNLVGCGRQ
jgi:hypothetical protein